MKYIILEQQSRVKVRETTGDPPSFDPATEVAVPFPDDYLAPHGPWRLKTDNVTWQPANEAQIVQSGIYLGEIGGAVTVADLLRQDRNAAIRDKALVQSASDMFEKDRAEAGYDTVLKNL
jgi:hypothetical protein